MKFTSIRVFLALVSLLHFQLHLMDIITSLIHRNVEDDSYIKISGQFDTVDSTDIDFGHPQMVMKIDAQP